MNLGLERLYEPYPVVMNPILPLECFDQPCPVVRDDILPLERAQKPCPAVGVCPAIGVCSGSCWGVFRNPMLALDAGVGAVGVGRGFAWRDLGTHRL